METGLSRSQIRQLIRERRQKLTVTEQAEAALLLTERLKAHSRVSTVKKLAIYLANDGELDTLPFIHWCWQQNIEVYLPVLHPFSPGNLLFLRYQQHTKMVQNRYQIWQPKLDIRQLCQVNDLDIIFTPLVAFDQVGNRLGMGGGFYDRTLANVNPSKLAVIGLAHQCQQVNALPIALWDIPLPEIITPQQHFHF